MADIGSQNPSAHAQRFHNYPNIKYEFYHGWKESQQLGVDYKSPKVERRNNTLQRSIRYEISSGKILGIQWEPTL